MGVKGRHSAHDEYLSQEVKKLDVISPGKTNHSGNKGRNIDHVTSVKKANMCLY